MPTQTTTLKLDQETKARLQRLGGARRRSAHWLMKEAVLQFLDREEKRERLRQDALAAWRDYQETGLHVTGDEMKAWAAELVRNPDSPPPEPHR
ncbi:MAG: CopG family ribbon-helix-helix protein [Terriglobales bacterium]